MGPPRERDGEFQRTLPSMPSTIVLQWGRRVNATESDGFPCGVDAAAHGFNGAAA